METIQEKSIINTVDYPFKSSTQKREIVYKNKNFTYHFIKKYNLSKKIDLSSDLIHTWAITCSPPYSSFDKLKYSSIFLSFYFYLNDFNDQTFYTEKYQNELSFIYQLISKGYIDRPPSKSLRGFAKIGKLILRESYLNDISIDEFKCSIAKLLNNYELELNFRKLGNKAIDFDDFLKMREYTGTVYPYLEMWKILMNFKERTYFAFIYTELKRLEQLCVQIIGIANDLFSIEADLRKKKLNAVIIDSFNNNLSISKSYERVLNLHNNKLETYIENRKDILRKTKAAISEEHFKKLNEYLILLDVCIKGSLDAMLILTNRYKTLK